MGRGDVAGRLASPAVIRVLGVLATRMILRGMVCTAPRNSFDTSTSCFLVHYHSTGGETQVGNTPVLHGSARADTISWYTMIAIITLHASKAFAANGLHSLTVHFGGSTVMRAQSQASLYTVKALPTNASPLIIQCFTCSRIFQQAFVQSWVEFRGQDLKVLSSARIGMRLHGRQGDCQLLSSPFQKD